MFFRFRSGRFFTRLLLFLAIAIGPPLSLLAQDSCRTGYSSPSVTGNVSYGNPINWSTPNKAYPSDDTYAQATLSSGDTSKYLRVKDFQFAVPVTAVITGIQARVEKRMDAGGNIQDASVKLSVNDVISGNDRKMSGVWSTTDLAVEYGGRVDMWGLSLSPADVNSSNFGVLVSATRTSGTGTKKAYVDDVALQIFFTVPAGTGCAPYFPLPVTLLSFKAAYDKGAAAVVVRWKSSVEINNSHYTIERSFDGVRFEAAGVLTGAGTSFSVLSYSFVDKNAAGKSCYYRLKQTDFDGKSEIISDVVLVNSPVISLNEISLFPNPASDIIAINGLNTGAAISILVLNEQGQAVFQHEGEASPSMTIDLSGKPKGLYFLELHSGQEKTFRKIILQ
jgi:hypothetical protein